MRNEIEKQVADTLDRLHEYASKADLAAYLSLFSEEAIFMGTDKNERWSMAKFRPYVAERFQGGRGWTYRTIERTIVVAPGDAVSWFDERLLHEKGEARGSGVLVLEGVDWQIVQYNLCFPIPNKLLAPFRDIIRLLNA